MRTFFFYDLETSGLNASDARIMQFAGQRTNEKLEPIGDPIDVLIKLSDDTLPSPEAVFVTKITPQQTLADGYSEAEFCRMLSDDVFTPNTTVVGYNNVRFDDEFIRYLFWRNFYDPYEWQYKDGRSRWDLLDTIRMMRALRPDGMEWPVTDKGASTNRLELLTKANGLAHEKAHDALSDVEALISVTRLVREKQPQLFNYLFKLRDKNEVKKIVNLDEKQAFVYSSGRYGSSFNSTTVAFPLTASLHSNIAVYDLRYDPTPFVKMSPAELKELFEAKYSDLKESDRQPLPIKELKYNRCPAVAPLGVLGEQDGYEKIGLTSEIVKKHQAVLLAHPDFAERVRELYENKAPYPKSDDAESQLYDQFLPNADKIITGAVRAADEHTLADFHPDFKDDRLPELLLHYKARNYPKSLSDDEAKTWQAYRELRIKRQLPNFVKSLERLSKESPNSEQEFLLEELKLWLENIMPDSTDKED